jgi:hypothetical protein
MTGVPIGARIATGVAAFAQTTAPLAWPVVLVAAAAWSSAMSRPVRTLAALALVMMAAQSSYLVWIGGDAWSLDYSNRFMATAVPVLLVATIASGSEPGRLFEFRAASILFVAVNVALIAALVHTGLLDLGPRSNWAIVLGWVVALLVPLLGPVGDGRLPARLTHRASVLAVVLAAVFVPSAHAWVRWAFLNAPAVRDDIAFAKQGLMLKDNLPPGAQVAATWLGAPSYFTGLRSIDLLGKTDRHVARLPGALPFVPGHNKMDLAYSVGTLRPDVVLLDKALFADYGYLRLPNGIWIKRDSLKSVESPKRLADSWCVSPTESAYCPQ